jgi:membrane protein
MTIWNLARDRLLSLGLVLGLAVVLILSVVVSAVLTALQGQFDRAMPLTGLVFHALNVIVSLGILTVMIGAVYKVLPDLHLRWRDVAVGALVTALLLSLGKLLIALYIGRTGIASSYGAAGSVVAVLLWIYYSAQIFLFGAEFTSVYAEYRARIRHLPEGSVRPNGPGSAARRPPSPTAG